MQAASTLYRRLAIGLWIMASGLVSGCYNGWLDPLPDTPENLRLAVVTVALKQNAEAAPRVTQETAEQMVREASLLWERACGISLVPYKHFEKDAEADRVPYRAQDDTEIKVLQYKYAHVNYVSVVFAQELRPSPEKDSIGGRANFPQWDRLAIPIAHPLRYVFAHELGHYLNLPHVQNDDWDETPANDPSNIMFEGDFPESYERTFVPAQCAEAKRYLLGFEHLRSLCRPDAADPALSRDNCPTPEL